MHTVPSFVLKLPHDIQSGVKTYTGSNIVLFKPKVYIANIPMYTHEEYHFFIPSTHSPQASIGNKEFSAGPNRLVAINPHSRMSLSIKDHTVTKEYAALSVNKSFMQRIATQIGFEKEVLFCTINNPCSYRIRQIIAMYEREMRENPSALVDDSISTLLIAGILRDVESNFTHRDKMDTGGETYIHRAIEYMQTIYGANITLGDICDSINISQYHFIRTFKRAVGKTPYEYLLDIRMQHAKELLDKEYPVSETAQQCGFINRAHFTTTFTSRFGMSPSQYKKHE